MNVRKGNPTSQSASSASSRSSRRHDALVGKLETCVNVLVRDGDLPRSLLGVFPGVLEGALLRFLSDVQRRASRSAPRPVATSSTRLVHFMDQRDRGRKTRAERESELQQVVKARRAERDLEFLNRGE